MGRRRNPESLSPQATYYDPRYNKHFYSGVLPPLPPQLYPTFQRQPRPPATPTVDVYPMKRTRRPSILITEDDDRPSRDDQLERRVSWDAPDDEGGEEGEENPRGDEHAAGKRRPLALAACAAIVLGFLVFAGMQLAAGYRAQGSLRARPAEEETTATTSEYFPMPVQEWNATTAEGVKEATEITASDSNSETNTTARRTTRKLRKLSSTRGAGSWLERLNDSTYGTAGDQ